MASKVIPQGGVHEGDCAVCGDHVRYVDYCPRIYLCLDCGFPDPADCVKADKDGYAFIVDDGETATASTTDTDRSDPES